jgi:hypothetical protein
MCLIENVVYAFGASFQENKSHLKKKVTCGFCFLGSVIEEGCKANPHILEELRNSIRREISTNTREELRRVTDILLSRHTKSIQAGKGKFPHLL